MSLLSRWLACRPAVAATFKRFNSTAAAQLIHQDAPPRSNRITVEDAKVPFTSLKGVINEQTLRALVGKPFELVNMTSVQSAVLPLLPALAHPSEPDSQEPRDLLVKARTGTGKTLAFLIPAMEARLNQLHLVGQQALAESGGSDRSTAFRAQRYFAKKNVGTLIISPTRELASQIATEAARLASHHEGFEVRLFVGGVSKRQQMREWVRGRPDIVVGTPGRLRDLLNSEPGFAECFKGVQVLVLDEADTLLDMGFRDDIEALAEFLPDKSERQTFLFSATVSPAIHQIAKAIMNKNHTFINTVGEETSPVHAHIPQYHTVLPKPDDQIPHLLRLIAQDQLVNYGKSKIIVFLPTTKMTQLFTTILRQLKRNALPAGRSTEVYEIHSKKSQETRTSTSDSFRSDTSGASVLVTSDVSARGVDYPNVTRVIQIGIPQSVDQYVHRVGRTGRRDLAGRGDLILLPWEVGFVTWQLTEIPLKPLTTTELIKQTTDLASQIDRDGPPHVDRPPLPRFSRSRDSRVRPPSYAQITLPVTPVVTNIEESVKALLPELDAEAIDETFASLLGYYFSKSAELRCQKNVILEGCKDYTTSALGLEQAPHVSQRFLEKLGFADGRTKKFGRGDRGSTFGSSSGQRFGDSPRPRFGDSPRPRFGDSPRPRFGAGRTQSDSGSDEFKGQRFGNSRSDGMDRSPRDSDFDRPRQSRFGSPRSDGDGRHTRNLDADEFKTPRYGNPKRDYRGEQKDYTRQKAAGFTAPRRREGDERY